MFTRSTAIRVDNKTYFVALGTVDWWTVPVTIWLIECHSSLLGFKFSLHVWQCVSHLLFVVGCTCFTVILGVARISPLHGH